MDGWARNAIAALERRVRTLEENYGIDEEPLEVPAPSPAEIREKAEGGLEVGEIDLTKLPKDHPLLAFLDKWSPAADTDFERHLLFWQDLGGMLREMLSDSALECARIRRLLLEDHVPHDCAAETCHQCGTAYVSKSFETEVFEYGAGPDPVKISCVVPVYRCDNGCTELGLGIQWTDHAAELLRDAAVREAMLRGRVADLEAACLGP